MKMEQICHFLPKLGMEMELLLSFSIHLLYIDREIDPN